MQRAALLNELAAAIVAIECDHPRRVAIDGVDGSGKTTLAEELAGALRGRGRNVIRASIDGFHNLREVRYRRRAESAEGYFLDSFNYQALKAELLDPLGSGGSRTYRSAIFDYRTDSTAMAPARRADDDDILLFDGVFLLRPELEQHWDFAIWVEAPFEITVTRAIERDTASVTEAAAIRVRHEDRYVPGQTIYMSRCSPQQRADVIVHNEDLLNPKLEYRKRSDET